MFGNVNPAAAFAVMHLYDSGVGPGTWEPCVQIPATAVHSPLASGYTSAMSNIMENVCAYALLHVTIGICNTSGRKAKYEGETHPSCWKAFESGNNQ